MGDRQTIDGAIGSRSETSFVFLAWTALGIRWQINVAHKALSLQHSSSLVLQVQHGFIVQTLF